MVDVPRGTAERSGGFRQHWLDGALGVVVGTPGPEGLDVPVAVGCVCVLVSVVVE